MQPLIPSGGRSRMDNMMFFRSLSRSQQSALLLVTTGNDIGHGLYTHYHAFYDQYEDFFVALCTTNDGHDFNLVFRDGIEYDIMQGTVGHDVLKATRARIGEWVEPGEEPAAVLAKHAFPFDPPDEGVFRALGWHEQEALLDSDELIGRATLENYSARYYQHQDFYVALCTTHEGHNFSLVYHEGHDYDNMVEAIELGKL